MSKRGQPLLQSDATRLMKAAKAAGYARARLITHPDGRIEIVGENADAPKPAEDMSPFEQWRAKDAR